MSEAYSTVVTREPEWDEASRARALQLGEVERNVDKQTGLPFEDAYDKDAAWMVHSSVNYAQRAIEGAREKESETHKNDSKPWMSGRTYYAVRVDPADLPAQPERTAQ